MQDKELLHELVIESREHLHSIEPDLLELEQKGDAVDSELINRVFRAVHSIKGGFGFFGLKSITGLSHSMENVMSRIRERDLKVSPLVMDALLQGIDKLRALLDDVQNSDSISIEEEIEKLSPFLVEGVPKADKTTAQPSLFIDEEISKRHPELNRSSFEDVLRNGKCVYEITLSAEDLKGMNSTSNLLKEKWEALGDVLSQYENNSFISIVFASVLEPDLIGTGLEIPDEKIRFIDLSSLKKELNSLVQEKQTDNEKKPSQSSTASAAQGNEGKIIEDALRVKVNLLNNLMNLAGELVLSRNQLLQRLNRKFIDASDPEKMLNTLEFIVSKSLNSIIDKTGTDRSNQKEIVSAELMNMKEAFRQTLSLRISDLPGVNTALGSIDSVTSMLQENIMQTRLQPVSVVFSKFPRVVRDLARKLGKQIDLEIIGQDVELDKSLIELLSDPLTHLIRNSVDHGIEMPADRQKKGKSPNGKIILRAFHEGGKVIIQIEDNGAGINLERVRKKAVEKGLVRLEASTQLSNREIQAFIMQPGFSTMEKVTDISGRGVGMDVVRSNIEKLGGSIDISSEWEKGTCFSLELPLTLAIIPSLIVTAEDKCYAIPQVSVEELVRIRSFEITSKIERIQGSEVLRLRDKLLPLVRLSDILLMLPTFIHPVTGERMIDKRSRWSDRRKNGSSQEEEESASSERRRSPDRRQNVKNAVRVIVLKIGENRFGLMVDSVSDSEEIVVKSLPEYLKSSQCYAGATIMGDGRVAMILDPAGIALKAGLKFSALKEQTTLDKDKSGQGAIKKDIIVFDNGTQECFGIDLSSISRIEKVQASEIEIIGDRQFLKHGNDTFPIIRLHHMLPVAHPVQENPELYVIIPKNTERQIGIVANKVHDVFNTEVILDTKSIKGIGILGSAVINKRMTIMLSLGDLIEPMLEPA